MAKDYNVGTACLRDAHIKVLKTIGTAAPDPQWRDEAVEYARQYHRECSMDPARAFALDALIRPIDRRSKHALSQKEKVAAQALTAMAQDSAEEVVDETITRQMNDHADYDEQIESDPPALVGESEEAFEEPARARPIRRRSTTTQYTIEPTPPVQQQPLRAHQLAGELAPAPGRKITLKHVIVAGLIGISLGYLFHKIIH